jgi:uncharacterized OB-fold protein
MRASPAAAGLARLGKAAIDVPCYGNSEMIRENDDDRFAKFGAVSFIRNSKVNDFVDGLQQGQVKGTKCTQCGRMFFPPQADCSQCLSSRMQWFEVAGTGALLAFSELAYAPVGFEDDVPYIIAVLDYGTFKIFGRIAGHIPEEALRVGMRMKTVVNELPRDRLSYVFQTV